MFHGACDCVTILAVVRNYSRSPPCETISKWAVQRPNAVLRNKLGARGVFGRVPTVFARHVVYLVIGWTCCRAVVANGVLSGLLGFLLTLRSTDMATDNVGMPTTTHTHLHTPWGNWCRCLLFHLETLHKLHFT